MKKNQLFCIYLIPYKVRRGMKYYCGHTTLGRALEREEEHVKYDQRTYTGRMRIVGLSKQIYRGMMDWGLLVSGFIEYSHLDQLTSRREAMSAERFVKREKRAEKKLAYEMGVLPELFSTRIDDQGENDDAFYEKWKGAQGDIDKGLKQKFAELGTHDLDAWKSPASDTDQPIDDDPEYG